jgi:uncharacterized protein YcfJ
MTDKNFASDSLGSGKKNNFSNIGVQFGNKPKAAALVAVLSIYSTSSLAEASYGQAMVVSSKPVYQTVVYQEPREVCRQERVAYRQSVRQSKTPGIIGALVGGTLGNAVGNHKSNKRVGAVVGSILGYSIAEDITHHKYEHGSNQQTTYRQQEVCDVYYNEREEQQLLGYDVSYVYAGRTYQTRLNQDPGESLRVRVSVDPA